MQDQFKSIGGFGTVFMAGLCLAVWAVPGEHVNGVVMGLRIGFPLAVLGFAALWIWAARRPDKAPDHLRDMFGKRRFDCNGIGFAVEMIEQDGQAMLEVYFQNRHARPGQLKLSLNARNSLGIRRLEGVSLMVQCDGAAFGVTHVPLAIPLKHQGKARRFNVQADAAYPSGRGKLLRFHPGQTVGKGETQTAVAVAAVLALGVAGALAFAGRSRSIKLRLPNGVSETLAGDALPVTENLWLPGDADENVRAHEVIAAA